ncbi:MAG: hypothetical protein JSW07_10560, partial [bacterium]
SWRTFCSNRSPTMTDTIMMIDGKSDLRRSSFLKKKLKRRKLSLRREIVKMDSTFKVEFIFITVRQIANLPYSPIFAFTRAISPYLEINIKKLSENPRCRKAQAANLSFLSYRLWDLGVYGDKAIRVQECSGIDCFDFPLT